VPTLVRMAPEGVRRLCFVVAEAAVFAFFALFAWAGARILPALEFDFMTTIPEISTQYTYSVIPIGAALYMIAQALSLPKAWRKSIPPDSAPLTH
jgi:TRAP-type C4-dicarboxylate transport system permease small subunit